MKRHHSFHIPVMGTGFTIDTPLKVARFGITSTISLVDHFLIGKIRKFYSRQFGENYSEIPQSDPDNRAREITEYLNLIDRVISAQIKQMRNGSFERGSLTEQYFEMLPDDSLLKKRYQQMLVLQDVREKERIQQFLKNLIIPGSIDVNIMTKLDRPLYRNGVPLGHGFSDAVSALRGFARSNLRSAVVFSAGVNLPLFASLEGFDDFYINEKGKSRKQIVLKVSDYRSALTQGKLFAKKGLWVSEYRIESGLNCGGHVFPTHGVLFGPVLDEFKCRKKEMVGVLFDMFREHIWRKKGILVEEPPFLRITAQGGICSANEDQLLREYFELDGTGWGTPFLVVPEVTAVDTQTLDLLFQAGKEDFYLSHASPLGVPFRNFRNSPRQKLMEKQRAESNPGASCRGKFLALNTEFCKEGICTASREYLNCLQKKKDSQGNSECRTFAVEEKECICTGLGDSALLKYGIVDGTRKLAPSICPGPGIVHFKTTFSLREMIDHIYGRLDLFKDQKKPAHLFIVELKLYICFLKGKVLKILSQMDSKTFKYFTEFKNNLLEGIQYYKTQIQRWSSERVDKEMFLNELCQLENKLRNFNFQPCSAML